MKGYTIQHSIDLLEKQIENGGGSGGASEAAQVSFDNSDTGLVATNVQSAITEVKGMILPGLVFSETETVVGSWLGETLYSKSYIYENTSGLSGTSDVEIATVDSGLNVKMVTGSIFSSTSTRCYPLPYMGSGGKATTVRIADDNKLVINTNGDSWGSTYTPIVVTIFYTKTAPASNTRSKKAKKEE